MQNIVSEAIQNDIQYYRDQNQVVEVYKADITNEISLFRKMHPELITLVEVIEHLESEAVTKVLENIFAYIRPRFVVVTTPNADFNVHFGLSNGKFRHWDHKFEWSRN